MIQNQIKEQSLKVKMCGMRRKEDIAYANEVKPDAIGYIFFSKGKSNPGDFEKGMTNYQKGMFQREIEDWKSSQGMPPNHNLNISKL